MLDALWLEARAVARVRDRPRCWSVTVAPF